MLLQRYLHPFLVWLVFINCANAVSLVALRNVAVLFATLRFAVTATITLFSWIAYRESYASAHYWEGLLFDDAGIAVS